MLLLNSRKLFPEHPTLTSLNTQSQGMQSTFNHEAADGLPSSFVLFMVFLSVTCCFKFYPASWNVHCLIMCLRPWCSSLAREPDQQHADMHQEDGGQPEQEGLELELQRQRQLGCQLQKNNSSSVQPCGERVDYRFRTEPG